MPCPHDLVHGLAGESRAEQPKRQLGILGDAPFVPAAELLERDLPDLGPIVFG